MTDPIPVKDAIKACERLIAICNAATIGYGEGQLAKYHNRPDVVFIETARATLKPLAELVLRWVAFDDTDIDDSYSAYPSVAAIIAHLDQTEPDWRTK